MKRLSIIMVIILLIGTIVPNPASSQEEEGEEELVLRVAMQDDIRTTNPLNAGGVWTWNVIGYLYDGPINVDPDTDETLGCKGTVIN